MLLLLFLLSVCSDTCHSQYAYSGMLPYEPPAYALRRPPPARRSAIEALERLRLPVARYFPQVDTQVASAPYPGGEPVIYSGGELYAVPQWADEFAQPLEEEPEYGNYEYEAYNPLRQRQAPVYAEEIYSQDPESAEYNDLMESYLMGAPERPQVFENIQRRSEEPAMPDVSTNATTLPPTVLPPTPQVQMTAVPASPEKKNVKSLVVPDPSTETEVGEGAAGQKEEPLFRPLQSSQRTTWSEGSPLSRAKNAMHKTPIPLLKQMIQNGREAKTEEDPLMEELNSLKKSL